MTQSRSSSDQSINQSIKRHF